MSIERGQIYFVDLDPIKGREQAGMRPVLVVSNNEINKRPLVVTVVVGTKSENVTRQYPTNVLVTAQESGLQVDTVFLCSQIRSLDHARFPHHASGKISTATLQRVENVLRYVLSL
jgi:mRNA interferase MazF